MCLAILLVIISFSSAEGRLLSFQHFPPLLAANRRVAGLRPRIKTPPRHRRSCLEEGLGFEEK
jgi:hypothetical protein